jgi:hypothetical protein
MRNFMIELADLYRPIKELRLLSRKKKIKDARDNVINNSGKAIVKPIDKDDE